MRFTTVNDLHTISIKDMSIERVQVSDRKLSMILSGGIIRSENPNNTRFQDVYCMQLRLDFQECEIQSFCLQGYKYYDADGNLLDEVSDQILEGDAKKDALKAAEGASVFEFGPIEDAGAYRLVYDVCDEDGDIAQTYQIDFTFEKSIASWDRFAGPVEG